MGHGVVSGRFRRKISKCCFNNLLRTLPDTLMLRIAHDSHFEWRLARIADTCKRVNLPGPCFPIQFFRVAQLTCRDVRVDVRLDKLINCGAVPCLSCPPSTGRARESAFTCDFACATRMVAGWGMKCSVLRAEEEVVGRIRHENLVTHIAGD